MKNSGIKRIYINLSNISTGGSIQVAMSFIEHVVNSEINPKFYFLFSKKLYNELNNSRLHLGSKSEQILKCAPFLKS